MILADRIVKLRKQSGWSQEELAEQMDVSRQSVSKWESAQSIPDLNKIVGMANLFGVTTDFLLKDSSEVAEFIDGPVPNELRQLTLEQSLSYLKTKLEMAEITVKGVALCVCSPIPLFFLLALQSGGQVGLSEEIAAGLGIISILVMVAIGVSFFVRLNQYEARIANVENEPFQLAYGVHGALSKKQDEYHSVYNRKMSIGIGMFILSAVPLLAVAIVSGQQTLVLAMLVVLLMIVAGGLAIVIPVSTESEALDLLVNEGDVMKSKSEYEQNSEKLGTFYWPIVVAIYLGWSLWSMRWDVSWIVWPVAAVAFAGFVGLMGLLRKDS